MVGLEENADESMIRLLLESNANVNATNMVHPGDECEGVVHGVCGLMYAGGCFGWRGWR